MEGCIFCSIASKKIPAKVVFENESIMAFRDINPVAPVHIVVITKKHIGSLAEAGADDTGLVGGLFAAIKEIAVSENIAGPGFRVVCNTGSDGGQTVNHIHFHLLGGRKFVWPPG